MKLNRLISLSLIALAVVSCKKSGEETLSVDSEVVISTVADESLNVVTKAATYDIPKPTNFTLKVIDAQGKVVLEDKELGTSKNINLARGSYKANIISDNGLKATFEAPSYVGEASFEAITGKTTPVEVVAKLNCVVVDVNFSKRLLNTFSKVVAQVWSADDQRLIFESANEKLAYYSDATKLNYSVTVTTQQGVSFTASGVAEGLKAADLLCLNFDIDYKPDDTTEPVVFDISLDRVLNEVTTTHVLGATMESYAAPSVTGRRVDISKPVGVKYQKQTNVSLDIVTDGGLNKVLLIVGDNYTQIAGMSAAVVNLMDEDVRNALGISFTEGGTVGSLSSLVNLVGLTSKLPGSETSSSNFPITIGVLDNNGQYYAREIIFNVYGSDVTTVGAEGYDQIDWFGVRGEKNRVNITFKGRYNVDVAPEDMMFYYRVKDSGSDWTVVNAVEGENKAVTALISLQATAETYEYKMVAGDLHADIMQFTLVAYPRVYNMDFDNWHVGGNSTYYPYPSNATANQKMWDTGNYGLTSASSLASFASNSVDDAGYQGKGRSAKLQAVVAKKATIGHFAPGNLFTGYFNFTSIGDAGSQPWVMPHFGVPFAGRPLKMKGYFKYTPKPITDREFNPGDGLGVIGTMDECEIYVKLERWNGADGSNRNADGSPVDKSVESIGFGCFRTQKQVSEFTEFSFDIDYYKQDVMPDHIIIVATSSRWGGYLTGGNGSTLWVDNFEFVY